MKAYAAFSSWATMVTRGSPKVRGSWLSPLSGPSQLGRWLRGDPLTERDDASTDGPADGRAGGRGAPFDRGLLDRPLLTFARDVEREHDLRLHGYHLLSSSFVGPVLVDVVVEGAARVGHEHVLEGRLASEPLARLGLELGRGAVGDDAAVVEDRDPGAEALGLGQVVGRQDDGRVMGLVDLLD